MRIEFDIHFVKSSIIATMKKNSNFSKSPFFKINSENKILFFNFLSPNSRSARVNVPGSRLFYALWPLYKIPPHFVPYLDVCGFWVEYSRKSASGVAGGGIGKIVSKLCCICCRWLPSKAAKPAEYASDDTPWKLDAPSVSGMTEFGEEREWLLGCRIAGEDGGKKLIARWFYYFIVFWCENAINKKATKSTTRK